MRAFLQRLRSAWLYLKYTPYVDAYDHEDFWNKSDAAVYSHFMQSPTGIKLRQRSANFVTRSAVNATREATNQTYACAWANGIAATFTWLDGHEQGQGELSEAEQKQAAFMEQFTT